MAHTNTDELKRIALGSGEVYVAEFTGTIPDDSEIETEANLLGYIQGGASIEYKPTFYTAKSDNGKATKTILTEEELTLKLGLITWNAGVLNKMVSTGTVTEKNGKRTLSVGGVGNQNVIKYLFRFVHTDRIDGDVRVTVVGSNQAGITLGYTKDKETAINPEIKGEPLNAAGNLFIYEEEILGLQNLSVTLEKGGTSGSTKVSVSPIPEQENSLVYHIGAESEKVTYGDAITTGAGWTNLNIGADITGVSANEVISVVEVSGGKAVKFGSAKITANVIAS